MKTTEPGTAGQGGLRAGALRTVSALLVITVIAYLALVQPVALTDLLQQIRNLSPWLWLQWLSLIVISYACRFMRWHLFITALGHRVPVGRQLHIYLAGFAMAVTPGKAGETVRSLYLRGWGVGYGHSVAAFVAERLLDLLTVGLLATMAIGWLLPGQHLWAWAAVTTCLGLVLLFRSGGLAWLVRRLNAGSMGRHTADGLATVSHLLSGTRLLAAMPLSALAWSAQGLLMFSALRALGQHGVAATDAIAVFALGLLAGVASFIPGGIGATETAMVLLLQTQGVNTTDALAAALLSRTLPLGLGLAVGVLALGGLALSQRERP